MTYNADIMQKNYERLFNEGLKGNGPLADYIAGQYDAEAKKAASAATLQNTQLAPDQLHEATVARLRTTLLKENKHALLSSLDTSLTPTESEAEGAVNKGLSALRTFAGNGPVTIPAMLMWLVNNLFSSVFKFGSVLAETFQKTSEPGTAKGNFFSTFGDIWKEHGQNEKFANFAASVGIRSAASQKEFLNALSDEKAAANAPASTPVTDLSEAHQTAVKAEGKTAAAAGAGKLQVADEDPKNPPPVPTKPTVATLTP